VQLIKESRLARFIELENRLNLNDVGFPICLLVGKSPTTSRRKKRFSTPRSLLEPRRQIMKALVL